jgi:hypothetical protein
MIIAARLQVKGDPIFKKTSLMLVIECTLISRAARDFDIQIMKRALLVFGIASVTLCASFVNKKQRKFAGAAGTDRPVDQSRSRLVRANRNAEPTRNTKISRDVDSERKNKAPAAQRVPPRQPVRAKQNNLPRQAPTATTGGQVFPPESSSSHSATGATLNPTTPITSAHCDTYGNAER